jgi:hypothetical protein
MSWFDVLLLLAALVPVILVMAVFWQLRSKNPS